MIVAIVGIVIFHNKVIDNHETVIEGFSQFGPTSGISITINSVELTTQELNGYSFSDSYNNYYDITGYSLLVKLILVLAGY